MVPGNLKPGDMIEWVYKHNNNVVRTDEELYSSTMHDWVPIGAPKLLVSIDKETYAWLTPKGLFHARVDDTLSPNEYEAHLGVVPRACG